ncbi:hypothetical protein B0T10DRAFT_99125 [Thelonectria olida]|uniref:Uncharacterized protein n=1 Tax=Thelonectria olida TaxID=1576542 RepID=A0A9P9ALP0_9HYPO|nr:hypothetical protein B0T10DRAFT_99125 [Thelonectria olida]
MGPPWKVKQWDPSQPNREPRAGLSDASFAQSIACNAENSSPVIVGGEDLTDVDHYAELPSIQVIIDGAIRSDDSATDSTDTPTSAGGASRKPILIPSDVDPDAEDSDDSDSSLPPAHKLIISVTQSRRRRISRMESPVTKPDIHNGTHSGEPTPLYGNGPCIANVATESPRSAPHCAADLSIPAHGSPAPCLAYDTFPETPHGCPGHLTLDSPEGQDFGLVDATKPGAIASDTIQTATSISSSQNASDSSNSALTSQLPIATLETVEVPNKSGDLPLSAALSRCSSISRARDATSKTQLSPEAAQSQDHTATGWGSSDVETQAHEASFGLSSGTQEASYPSQEPMMRRHSHRQAAHRSTRYDDDSDSNADGDSEGSEDFDDTNSTCDEDYCSPLTTGKERGQKSKTSDEGEQCPRKRHRVSQSPTGLMRHAAASAKRSRQCRASQRYSALPPKGRRRSWGSGILSPASSQATSSGICLGRSV